MARKKSVKASPEEAVRQQASMLVLYLAEQFSCGFESVPMEDLLDNDVTVGRAVDYVHAHVLVGNGGLLSADLKDAFEAMNCVLINGMDSVRAEDSTDSHGDVGSVIHAEANLLRPEQTPGF
jgi:hypothetical protein